MRERVVSYTLYSLLLIYELTFEFMLELERGPHPISDSDGRIYRLAVPVLKKP